MKQPKTETHTNETPSISAMPDLDPLKVMTDERNRLDLLLTAAAGENAELKARLEVAEKNPLLFALLHIDAGCAAIEAGEKLADLAEKVTKLNGAGTMTIKLKLKPLNNAVLMSADVAVKAPEQEKVESVFYRGADGLLQREDPRQGQLQFGKKRREREDEE
jgi:hypothetical protein